MKFAAQICVALVWLALNVATAKSADLGEGFDVVLQPADGPPVRIASIDFTPVSNGYSYVLKFDDEPFTDQFLSMRPFKCLEKPGLLVCHLKYSYAKGTTISATDLMDLEYEFLFLHKTPKEYGINAWNGLYYKLEETAAGLRGTLHEVDLGVLSAPPDDDVERPVEHAMLYPASAAKHWFPTLTIEAAKPR